MSETDEQHPSVEQVIHTLQNAVTDLKKTSDYLSYATLIDIYLADVSIYTDKEKSAILTALADIFESNIDIVEALGWDLPEVIFGFFNMDWDFAGSLLTGTDLITLIMRNFDLIAKHGNAKELFIKAIELLGDIDFPDPEDEADRQKLDRVRDVQIHTLIELLSTSLKRIKTIYPSKFLGMAVTSLLRLLSRYIQHDKYGRVIFRRIYAFARDYYPPAKPQNYLAEHGITEEEGLKIEEDENYLQRTLLQSFLSNSISIPTSQASTDISLELYRDLQDKNKGLLPKPKVERDDEDLGSTKDILFRFYNLELSYDIDLALEFEKLKTTSVELFGTIDATKSEDDKIQDLFKISINDIISNVFHPESETIPLSNIGLFLSYTLGASEHGFSSAITSKEIVAITIRLLSPGLLADKFKHIGALDSALYWNWKAVINAKTLDFKDIPSHQIILYLQILIYYSATTSDARYRLVIFTLLTRVLSLLDESISYNFIIDTLTTAPFENAKSGMIYVLKDMILRTRPSSIDGLIDSLKATTLTAKADNRPPPLPSRHYIELNKDRIDDIYALIRESIDESFSDSSASGFQTLLGYLNLLIGIKGKFPSKKVKEIVDITNEKIADYKKELDSKQSTPIELLVVSLETLGDGL